MTVKRHEPVTFNQRLLSTREGKIQPPIFFFANSCRQINIFCAKIIFSSHFATMAIGSANPDSRTSYPQFEFQSKQSVVVPKFRNFTVDDRTSLYTLSLGQGLYAYKVLNLMLLASLAFEIWFLHFYYIVLSHKFFRQPEMPFDLCLGWFALLLLFVSIVCKCYNCLLSLSYVQKC